MALLTACVAPAPSPELRLLSGPLQGSIAATVYHDKRDWFTVAIPFQRDRDLEPGVSIQEEYPTDISFVGFQSEYRPGEYYRVYAEDFFATNHPVPDMDHVADAVLGMYGRQLMAARSASLAFKQEKQWSVGSTHGLLRLYTQKVPTELLSMDIMHGQGLAEDYTAYILMYVTAQNGKVGMLWAEWPEDCTICAPIPAGPAPAADADVIDKALGLDARVRAFFDSFSYAAGASAYQ